MAGAALPGGMPGESGPYGPKYGSVPGGPSMVWDPTIKGYVHSGKYTPGNFGEQMQKDAFDAKSAALKALQAQLATFQGTGYSPPGGTPGAGPTGAGDPYDPAADAATYGRAKERTGLAAQSAIRGLRSSLSGRGVTGAGIERANTGQIFGGALDNLAETDRQLAENTATRRFSAGESAAGRAVTMRGQDISAAQAQQSMWLEKFKALLSAYSSAY